MTKKFSHKIKSVILKILKKLLCAESLLPWQQSYNRVHFFSCSCGFKGLFREISSKFCISNTGGLTVLLTHLKIIQSIGFREVYEMS